MSQLFSIDYPDVDHLLYSAKINEDSPNFELSWEHKGFEWMTKDQLLMLELPVDCDPFFVDVINFLKAK